ncbi:hypothetical protein ACQPZF_10575 [Actinosynnema sp. CS-041913]|uniref:hypothetical protein n=1 Tax=Actinosynnema sp. CS-041913 TaxID=3239917 RepID=UPI003D8F0F37
MAQTLTTKAGPARPEPADTARLEALTARAEAAAAALQARISPMPLAEGLEGRIDTLHRAEATGFVAVYWAAASTSGRPNLDFRVHFTPLF